MSAGGGGADSGARTQAALHPIDYLAMQQNANELSRQLAVTAALAPLRVPVVVGIIAFGLLNPDPTYAPTFQTVPEDRSSVLEQAGEVGLAVAVGAIGIKLGQVEPAIEGTGARATQIHRAVGEATQRRTTIAVTETVEGTRVISSSEHELRPAQRAMLRSGEVAVVGPGHAEVTGVQAAQRMGLTPTAVGASRPICPACSDFLQGLGIKPASPLK